MQARQQQRLLQVDLEEDHYEELLSTWRLGFHRVGTSLLRGS